MWQPSCALLSLLSRQTNFSLHVMDVRCRAMVRYRTSLPSFSIWWRILTLALLRIACLRSAESVREFVSAVTSSDAVIGKYTLIGRSVVTITILIRVEEFSALALLLLAHSLLVLPAGFMQ